MLKYNFIIDKKYCKISNLLFVLEGWLQIYYTLIMFEIANNKDITQR